VGLAFLGDLARQRSLASAALLFLVLVDEIEGLAFLAFGLGAHRLDLFLASQDWLFPAVVVLAGALSLVRNWRRRTAQAAADPMEMLDAAMLSARTGDLQAVAVTSTPNPIGLSTSPYARSPERTSRRG
jgi:hypothetical protein